MASIPEVDATDDLQSLKEYVETQMEGIARSSITEAGRGAMRAFANVLAKINELQKVDEKPRSMTLQELIEDVDASERIAAEDLRIIINT